MAVDERRAVAQMQQRDIRGLAELVRAYQLRALRAAYLITHDRTQAEDIVQSAFIRAYERIDQFDAERSFGPWFLRIVANDAAKAAGRNRRQISIDQHDDPDASPVYAMADPGPGPEAVLLAAETTDEVWVALQELSPEQRAAVVLRYHLELTEADVADRLGIPTGTAKSRLHHARGRLRGALGALRQPRSATADEAELARPKEGGTPR